MDADVIESTSLPKDPDRSHLADAIHFMDLIRLADDMTRGDSVVLF
jgi:hypothetical protein